VSSPTPEKNRSSQALDLATEPIGVAAARRVLARAREFARGADVSVATVMVDSGGNPVAGERMDGAPFVAFDLAREKAWTAAAFEEPTNAWAEISRPGGKFWGLTSALGGRICVMAGGVPITNGNRVVGAVGVSGGDDGFDHACAEHAAKGFWE